LWEYADPLINLNYYQFASVTITSCGIVQQTRVELRTVGIRRQTIKYVKNKMSLSLHYELIPARCKRRQ